MTERAIEEAGPSGPVSSSFHIGKKCTHNIRKCVECGERFEGCSMQRKQETCSKLCWNRHFRQGANDKRPRKRTPVPIAPGMKWCRGCSQLLPESAFHQHAARGLQPRCKTCQRIQFIEYHYGMNESQARRYMAATSCELCGGPPLGRSKQLDIDHDHVTGKVRGFLCNRCNKVLGYAKDDPAILRAAAEYLERTL